MEQEELMKSSFTGEIGINGSTSNTESSELKSISGKLDQIISLLNGEKLETTPVVEEQKIETPSIEEEIPSMEDNQNTEVMEPIQDVEIPVVEEKPPVLEEEKKEDAIVDTAPDFSTVTVAPIEEPETMKQSQEQENGFMSMDEVLRSDSFLNDTTKIDPIPYEAPVVNNAPVSESQAAPTTVEPIKEDIAPSIETAPVLDTTEITSEKPLTQETPVLESQAAPISEELVKTGKPIDVTSYYSNIQNFNVVTGKQRTFDASSENNETLAGFTKQESKTLDLAA